MDAHKDLMEAALNAVNAVEAKKNGQEMAEIPAASDVAETHPVEAPQSNKPEIKDATAKPERPVNAPRPAAKTARLPQFPGLAEIAAKVRKDTPAAPVSNAPAAPVSDAPAAPVSDAPAAPVSNAPAAPESDAPAAPVSNAPAAPVSDAPAAPVSNAPAAPESDASAAPETAEDKPKDNGSQLAVAPIIADNQTSISAFMDDDQDDDLDIELSFSGFDNLVSDENICVEEIAVVSGDAVNDEKVNALETKVAELEQQLIAIRGADATLRQENEQLKLLAKQLNDRMVRVSADFDNYKKRVARDQEQNKNQAQERIVTGFLGVMDNLERALTHARQSNDYDQLLQGVEMTAKLFTAALGKQGCTPYDSLGAEFDPVYHDVLSRVIDAEKPHNSIVQEHLKGYIMHERVLRPALVVVSQHEDGDGE